MQADENRSSWPPIDGAYLVGDPASPIAVCTLTSTELLQPLAKVPGVAIVGQLYTANIGIEHVVCNVIANPAIRFLLLCGKESRLFLPGQSLRSLLENGVDGAGMIVNAPGYEPVLRNLSRGQIDRFRRQVNLVDWSEERDVAVLAEHIQALAARRPAPFSSELIAASPGEASDSRQPAFQRILPGGRREPLSYDPTGYFVISLDRAEGLIIVRHYLPGHIPAHEMRGRTAESLLLGLLRENLISQLSHAGYLGMELAKAESALRLGTSVHYEQDRPLRRSAPLATGNSEQKALSRTGPATSMTWDRFADASIDSSVDVALEITTLPAGHLLAGLFLEPGAADPVRTFRRTYHPLRVLWSSTTQVVMGKPEHFEMGALLRAIGRLRRPGEIEAEQIAVISKVSRLLPDEE